LIPEPSRKLGTQLARPDVKVPEIEGRNPTGGYVKEMFGDALRKLRSMRHERFARWRSVTTPSHKLSERFAATNVDSCPKLSGIPLILLLAT